MGRTRSCIGVALLVKIAAGTTLLVPRGFDARYYANDVSKAPIQPSAESWDASFTRVDRRLRFGVDGSPDVPVAFFNDLRYGFFRETDPKREGLPFSIMWQGLWRVTEPGRQRSTFILQAAAVTLTIGDAISEHIDAAETWTGDVESARRVSSRDDRVVGATGRRAAAGGRPRRR